VPVLLDADVVDAEAGELRSCPQAVRDEQFASLEVFDACDLVQVKYEMVRRMRVEGAPVVSQPSYYEAAAAVDRDGLPGLVPARPGLRRAHKLTDEVVAYVQQLRGQDPTVGRRSWRPRSPRSSRSGCTRGRWSAR
jgi:hypothetical protein